MEKQLLKKYTALLLVIALLASFVLAGCGKKPVDLIPSGTAPSVSAPQGNENGGGAGNLGGNQGNDSSESTTTESVRDGADFGEEEVSGVRVPE